jgi:hypothetical protein
MNDTMAVFCNKHDQWREPRPPIPAIFSLFRQDPAAAPPCPQKKTFFLGTGSGLLLRVLWIQTKTAMLSDATVARMRDVVHTWARTVVPFAEKWRIRWDEKNGSLWNVEQVLLASGFSREEVIKKNVYKGQVNLYESLTKLLVEMDDAKKQAEKAAQVAHIADDAEGDAEGDADEDDDTDDADEDDDTNDADEDDDTDTVIVDLPSRLTMTFKRDLDLDRIAFESVVGREAWESARSVVKLQLDLDALQNRLRSATSAWSEKYVSDRLDREVEEAVRLEAEADGFVNVHSSMAKNFEQLIGMCKDPSKVAEYEAFLATSAAELSSAQILKESRRNALARARSSLSELSICRRFIDENYEEEVFGSPASAAKNRSRSAKIRWPDTPSGVRPTSAVAIKPEAIKLMKETFAKLEKEHGDVFGTFKATTTPCDCSRCKKTSSQHPPSPLVKHIWAAFSLDGTLDVANTGVWSATTRRRGEPLGPRCLGRGHAKPAGGGKYHALISSVCDRIFGLSRNHESFFFVHHHADPLSPANKYLILVPKPCESDPKFFENRGFPGYSSSSDVFFGRSQRTTNPKAFCKKLYGTLGWKGKSSWEEYERTGNWTTLYYPEDKTNRLSSSKKRRDADDEVPQKKTKLL